MLNVNDFKPGVTFEFDNNLYLVIESSHSKQGRGQANVKVKVKNLRTNTILVLSFTGGEKVKKAMIDRRNMQYLYNDNNHLFFMDLISFDQIEMNSSKLEWEKKILIEGAIVKIMFYDKEILGIELPPQLSLKVIETEPAVKGDTVTNVTKKATLSTGLEIQVPQFIENDEMIIIDSSTGKYISREKK